MKWEHLHHKHHKRTSSIQHNTWAPRGGGGGGGDGFMRDASFLQRCWQTGLSRSALYEMHLRTRTCRSQRPANLLFAQTQLQRINNNTAQSSLPLSLSLVMQVHPRYKYNDALGCIRIASMLREPATLPADCKFNLLCINKLPNNIETWDTRYETRRCCEYLCMAILWTLCGGDNDLWYGAMCWCNGRRKAVLRRKLCQPKNMCCTVQWLIIAGVNEKAMLAENMTEDHIGS